MGVLCVSKIKYFNSNLLLGKMLDQFRGFQITHTQETFVLFMIDVKMHQGAGHVSTRSAKRMPPSLYVLCIMPLGP